MVCEIMLNKPLVAKHYCVLTPHGDQYILSAIKKIQQQIIFEGFYTAPLANLAARFHTYGLILALSDQQLEIYTQFCQTHDATTHIYQKIITQTRARCKTVWFDFERITSTENANEEQLVISYHLSDDQWLKPYRQLGFHFAAWEPISVAQKRTLEYDWQKKAFEDFCASTHGFDQETAVLHLKLLGRNTATQQTILNLLPWRTQQARKKIYHDSGYSIFFIGALALVIELMVYALHWDNVYIVQHTQAVDHTVHNRLAAAQQALQAKQNFLQLQHALQEQKTNQLLWQNLSTALQQLSPEPTENILLHRLTWQPHHLLLEGFTEKNTDLIHYQKQLQAKGSLFEISAWHPPQTNSTQANFQLSHDE